MPYSNNRLVSSHDIQEEIYIIFNTWTNDLMIFGWTHKLRKKNTNI